MEPTKKITIHLYESELEALTRFAATQRRRPREQAAVIVYDFLVERGLLESGDKEPDGASAEV